MGGEPRRPDGPGLVRAVAGCATCGWSDDPSDAGPTAPAMAWAGRHKTSRREARHGARAAAQRCNSNFEDMAGGTNRRNPAKPRAALTPRGRLVAIAPRPLGSLGHPSGPPGRNPRGLSATRRRAARHAITPRPHRTTERAGAEGSVRDRAGRRSTARPRLLACPVPHGQLRSPRLRQRSRPSARSRLSVQPNRSSCRTVPRGRASMPRSRSARASSSANPWWVSTSDAPVDRA